MHRNSLRSYISTCENGSKNKCCVYIFVQCISKGHILYVCVTDICDVCLYTVAVYGEWLSIVTWIIS